MKVIAQARNNFHDYRIIRSLVGGLVLTGNEIKSVRSGRTSIVRAYVMPIHRELFVSNMHIAVHSSFDKSDSLRKRKLLLKRREIKKLISEHKVGKYVIVPLRLFINERGWAKLEIALAQRLRKYQIKEKLKEREIERRLRKGEILAISKSRQNFTYEEENRCCS